MNNSRTIRIALVLLLALSSSGLQVLCAPCGATPMACHTDVRQGGDRGDMLRAGCCCLLDAGAVDYAPDVLAVEPVVAATCLPGRAMAIESPSRPVMAPALRTHASQARPPLFQLHCSFLI